MAVNPNFKYFPQKRTFPVKHNLDDFHKTHIADVITIYN